MNGGGEDRKLNAVKPKAPAHVWAMPRLAHNAGPAVGRAPIVIPPSGPPALPAAPATLPKPARSAAKAAVQAVPRPPGELELEQQRLARAAAARIWQRHRVYLHGLSLRWLRGDRVEAEDAVADVVYKASVALGRGYLTLANERAWLTRVLHNRCMDAHRHRRPMVALDTQGDSGEDDGEAILRGVSQSAEEMLLNRELGEVIGRALAELPEVLRGPVTMRLVNDEAYSSISERFMITEANARKRIQQAREILRQRLQSYLHDNDRPRPKRAPVARAPGESGS